MQGDAFSEIKARVDLVELAQSYTRLARSGADLVGLCPIHGEKTPSFRVSPHKQLWYCHGCNRGGDIFDLTEGVERVDRRAALELLAERAGIDLEKSPRNPGGSGRAERRRRVLEMNSRAAAYFTHVLWETEAGSAGRELLRSRSVDVALAKRFDVGFAPAGGDSGDALLRYLVRKGATPAEVADAGLAHPAGPRGPGRDRFRHRLVFPIRDERGATIAFGARALGTAQPKYLNSPDTDVYSKSVALYGIDLARQAILDIGQVVIVEGYFDVMAAHAAEVANVVASSGTALSSEQIRALGRLGSTFVLCFDGDRAGTAAGARAVDLIAAAGFASRIIELPDGVKDPDELRLRDPSAFARCVAGARAEWEVLLDRALGSEESGSVEDRRSAEQRAVTMLARIPSAGTQALYVQAAARRLDVPETALAAEVARVARGARMSVRPVVRSDVGVAQVSDDADAGPAEPTTPLEETLGSLVVQAPQLALRLVGEFGLEVAHVRHAAVRALLERALATPEGTPAVSLEGLASADRQLAARLGVAVRPELRPDADPALLDRVLADVAAMFREEPARPRLEDVRRRLRRARDEGRAEEADTLYREFRDLAAAAPRARHTMRRR